MRKIKPLGGDYIVIAVTALAAVLSLLLTIPRGSGSEVTVNSPGGVSVYNLFADAEFEVEGMDGIVMTVVIKDGSVFAAESGCPDRLCVKTGKISRPGETIICLPAHIIITVGGENEGGEHDFVAG